jgi:predicted amidophosphoribosyltransferase
VCNTDPFLSQGMARFRDAMTLAQLVADLVCVRGCVRCGDPGGDICHVCAASLRPAASGRIPGGIDRAVVPWAYEGAGRALVLRLKLGAVRSAAYPLVAGMRRAAVTAGGLSGIATWVPGKPADTRRRGFDHAELLARGVSAGLGLPCRGLLDRRRIPLDQAALGAADRRANLAGVFRASSSPPRVVLVDDLITTGATAEACARALWAGGAESVDLLVACRA